MAERKKGDGMLRCAGKSDADEVQVARRDCDANSYPRCAATTIGGWSVAWPRGDRRELHGRPEGTCKGTPQRTNAPIPYICIGIALDPDPMSSWLTGSWYISFCSCAILYDGRDDVSGCVLQD
ncbi:hypothetical protein CBL_06159 [Carabus blaptoides fortunei]